MKTLVLISVLTLLLPRLAGAQAKRSGTGDRKPALYNDVSKGSAEVDRVLEKAYADKFRVLEATLKDGFQAARIKGEWGYLSDPRSMRLWRIPGRVKVAFAVTPEGRVADPRVLESTDPLFAKGLLAAMPTWRFVPARYRGTPVFSLFMFAEDFESSSRDGNGIGKDGLGIMGYRDR